MVNAAVLKTATSHGIGAAGSTPVGRTARVACKEGAALGRVGFLNGSSDPRRRLPQGMRIISRADLNRLIAALRTARDAAYGRDE
jgi:hypothetical protein